MAIQKTGYLTLQWDPIVGAEDYSVNIYENSQFLFSQVQAATEITVSGFGEGDTLSGLVYAQSGFLQSSSGTPVVPQSIAITNFHESGKTFEFDSFTLDGIGLDFSKTGHGYYATGNYEDQNSLLEFQLKNPRDESILSTFGEEPFLSGVTYQTSDPYSTNYNSGSLYDFAVSVPNNTLSRNYTTQIEVIDYYGSGITGFISLNTEAISIPSVRINSNPISTKSGSFELIPSYSRPPTGLEYVISRDSNFTDLIVSGITSETYNVTGLLPTSTTGFVSLTPYDWFGSGHKLIPADAILINNTGFEYLDSILDFSFSLGGDNTNFITTYSATSGNPSGHYFSISIDPASTGAHSSHSYSTGYLYPDSISGMNSGHLFNYFDGRTGTHETFYGTLNLYQSGTDTFADSATSSIEVPYPKFINSGVSFDYLLGKAEMHFHSSPDYTFSGIDVLFSGQNSSDYITYSGYSFETGDLYSHAKVKLARADDHNSIYDSLEFTGSGELPEIRTRPIDFMSIESTINTTLLRGNDVPIDYIQVYRKPAFKIIDDARSGYFPEAFSGILDFNDFTGGQVLVSGISGGSFNFNYSGSGFSGGFLYEQTSMGHYLDKPPKGIGPNTEYTLTGIGFTGYYESGRHYMYRFVPYNGFGSGHLVPSEVFEFNVNEVSQGTENVTINNTTNINTIQNKYIVFSGNKEFHGNIDLNPKSGCLALDVRRNVRISGYTGSGPSEICKYALDVQGDTMLSGNATVGTGEHAVFEVMSGRSNFYHDVYVDRGDFTVSGNATVGTGGNVVFEVTEDRTDFYHDVYVTGVLSITHPDFYGGNTALTVSGISEFYDDLYVQGEAAYATSFTATGDDPRIKVDGIANSVPGYEWWEAETRKWVVYSHYATEPYHNNVDNLNFKTNTDIRMSITQDGNVGINTTTPGFAPNGVHYAGFIGGATDGILHLRGVTSYPVIAMGKAAEGNDHKLGSITFINDDNAHTAGKLNQAAVAAIIPTIYTNDNNLSNDAGGNLGFWTKEQGSISAEYSERMRIAHDGNVGIGTSTPSAKLEVVGTISGTDAIFGGLSPVLLTGAPPSSHTSYGVSGQMSIDGNYLYVCNGPNKWGRVAVNFSTPW